MKKRKIKKYAGMWVIKLFPMDVIDMEIKEDDEVNIEDIRVIKKKGGKK